MTESDRTTPDKLTVPQAATLWGVSERTLRRWVAAGKLPSVPDPSGGSGRLVDVAQCEAHPAFGQLRPKTAFGHVAATRNGHAAMVTGQPRPVSEGDRTGAANGPMVTLRNDMPSTSDLLSKALLREGELRLQVSTLSRAADEVAFLRERLAAADREKADMQAAHQSERERAAESERELRVLVLRAQETAQALTGQLEQVRQAALPEPKPRRPWWKVWGS